MKIGILTKYYNNKNYGGLLQAYALVQYLKSLGHETEQISLEENNRSGISRYCFGITRLRPKERIILVVQKLKEKFLKKNTKSENDELIDILNVRYQAMKDFEMKVSHSKKYNTHTIGETNNIYDAFVVGSDQVWNLEWFQKEYFLEFADCDKLKVSYAASMPKTVLYKDQQKYIQDKLSKFNYISVRENVTEKFFREKLGIETTTVVDPTMLLDKQKWDKLSDKRIIEQKYIFCYFLGGSKKLRTLAAEFAKKNNLICATIPYLSERNVEDKDFAEKKIYNASPEMFLSLIRYAEYIFTDSFHGTVFSSIFNKNFFVFQRSSGVDKYMTSRIVELLNILHKEDRLKDENTVTVSDLMSIGNADYQSNNDLENAITKSKDYLKRVFCCE